MEVVITTDELDSRIIQTAAKIIKDGGIIVFPTDTFYGIGVDPFNKVAVSQVFALKHRVSMKPLLNIIHDASVVKELATDIPSLFFDFSKRFWPGPLTISLPANKKVPDITTAYTRRVGMRIPNSEISIAIAKAVGGPITATSANISGEGHIADPEKVKELFSGKIGMIIDSGMLTAKAPSTLIDIYPNGYKILREGAISKKQLLEVSDKLIE
jgi:L-threonylcarbamoyladenylate synthase